MTTGTRRLGAVSGVLAVLAAAGCATVVNGFDQELAVNTQPAGALVSLSNGQACTSPCTMVVPRDLELVAAITKPGCDPIKRTLYSVPRPGNTGWFSSSVLYSAADYETGAAYRLTPNPLDVQLFCGPSELGPSPE